jgi:hypothetical protein
MGQKFRKFLPSWEVEILDKHWGDLVAGHFEGESGLIGRSTYISPTMTR